MIMTMQAGGHVGAAADWQAREVSPGKAAAMAASGGRGEVWLPLLAASRAQDPVSDTAGGLETQYSSLLHASEQLYWELEAKTKSFVVLEEYHLSLARAAGHIQQLEADLEGLDQVASSIELKQTLRATEETGADGGGAKGDHWPAAGGRDGCGGPGWFAEEPFGGAGRGRARTCSGCHGGGALAGREGCRSSSSSRRSRSGRRYRSRSSKSG